MKTFLAAVLVLVLVGIVGFGAYSYGESVGFTQAQNIRAEFFSSRQGATNGAADPAQAGASGQRGGLGARAAATGTVKAVQGNTVTVTQRDGSTVTVNIDSQTVIQKTTSGLVNDIQPGQSITVMSSQTGANITAQTIQIRPAGQ
jgi:hypothetical protein